MNAEAEIWNEMTALLRRLKKMEQSVAKVGKPCPLATAEMSTTSRELTIGDQTFRVLTVGDS